MKLDITHKGDYLTFASIGASVGLPFDVMRCEYYPGVFRRYDGPFFSRSSISRDGYLGLCHYLWSIGDDKKPIVDRIIKAGWKRKWNFDTQPEKAASSDYTNMSPFIPILYAMKYNKPWLMRALPTVAVYNNLKGFRAHLLAMTILLQMRMGVFTSISKWSMKRLVQNSPRNPLFILIYCKIARIDYDFSEVFKNFENTIGCHGWGSCEPIVFEHLCYYVHTSFL